MSRHQHLTPDQVRTKLVHWACWTVIISWSIMTLIFSWWYPPVVQASEPEVIVELEYQESNKQQVGGSREYEQISFIVVHHTATRDDLTASQMKLSMQRTYIDNRWGKVIPTHFIIDKWGNLERVNPIHKIVWATLNPVANIQWVHIELVWDFNKWHPTQYQYDTLNALISRIENEVGSYLPFKGHGDFQPKNCPGVNFDFSQLKHWKERNVWDKIYFNEITAYYTPQPTDKTFSHWTYERSTKVNWDMVNAMWWDYKDYHKYTHWACWRRFDFWTILDIEWRGRVVCVDRWSAIDNNDFDIWYGVGDEALSNIRGKLVHPQQNYVTLIHLP